MVVILFQSADVAADLKPEHDLFIEHLKLQNTLRIMMGEEVLDHSGLDYHEPDKEGREAMAAIERWAPRKSRKSKAEGTLALITE